jgi:VWFA-related protein
VVHPGIAIRTKLLGIPAAIISAVLLAWSSPAARQNAAATPQTTATSTPTVHSVSNLVIVDVVVTEHGQAVQGLGRDDFHILEDGHQQTVKAFEEHKAAEAAQPQPPPPLPPHIYSNYPELPAASAVNVLLLDALNTPLQDQMYVRGQMVEYLKSVPPRSYMAIFTLGTRLRIVQGFAARPEALVAALQSPRQSPAQSSLLPDPNDPTSQNLLNAATQAGETGQALAAIQQFQAETAVFQTDLRVLNTLDALNQLADYLGPIPGRKNLIWLSGSFPLTLDPDTSLSAPFNVQREYSTQIEQTSDRLTAARVAVYPIDVRGLLNFSALSAANRNPNYSGAGSPSPSASIAGPGAAPGGGRGGARRSPSSTPRSNLSNPNSFATDNSKFLQQTTAEHATMDQIAEETGGLSSYNKNDIKDALTRDLDNGSNYYTLAYVPEDKNLDGRFRKIHIQLANKDYQLSYRHGYYAGSHSPASVSALTPTASMIQRGAPPSAEILFKVRVLAEGDPELAGLKPQPGPAGVLANKLKGPVKRYWIDFAADMHQVDLSLGSDGLYHASLEFVTLAYDRDGKLLNVTTGTYKVHAQPGQYAQIMQTGLPVHEEMDIPPGEIYLRFGVHDLTTDRIGTTEIPLKVTVP